MADSVLHHGPTQMAWSSEALARRATATVMCIKGVQHEVRARTDSLVVSGMLLMLDQDCRSCTLEASLIIRAL
jgi:hypothetical protein